MKYTFIRQHREVFSTQRMCSVLGVARSGYYAWLKIDNIPSARRQRQTEINQRVALAYHHRKGRSGAPRLTLDLHDEGLILPSNGRHLQALY
ncbi:hypothetical protein DU490_05265 [Halomonas sp. DQ26W]|nr:hypothetical protein DU490_05265 [Halomonas sp. DQ26W]